MFITAVFGIGFSVMDGKIRYALTAIKGVGRPVIEAGALASFSVRQRYLSPATSAGAAR